MICMREIATPPPTHNPSGPTVMNRKVPGRHVMIRDGHPYPRKDGDTPGTSTIWKPDGRLWTSLAAAAAAVSCGGSPAGPVAGREKRRDRMAWLIMSSYAIWAGCAAQYVCNSTPHVRLQRSPSMIQRGQAAGARGALQHHKTRPPPFSTSNSICSLCVFWSPCHPIPPSTMCAASPQHLSCEIPTLDDYGLPGKGVLCSNPAPRPKTPSTKTVPSYCCNCNCSCRCC
ncbi:hypothetical protein F4808DRAFT_74269 [Astrocystis sublimbata]|nr:hypothetical protein F4808DRAFT_74269 [Astrocystis sublimbata]